MADAVRAVLDAAPFAARSRRIRLLGFDVEVRSDVDTVVELVETVWSTLLVDDPGPADHLFTLTVVPPEPRGTPTWRLHLDGALVVESPIPAVAVTHLLWEANRQALERTPDRALLHAAAVTRGDRAAILVGPQESGKSTLAAALVGRYGLGYLTDEAVAVDPATGAVAPYPKYVSVGADVGTLLPELAPVDDPRLLALLGDLTVVPAATFGPDRLPPATRAAAVVLPTYVPDAPTEVEVLSPAAALHAVAQHAYHVGRDGDLVVGTLARVVASSPCVRVRGADLDAACAVVLDLLGADGVV
ncbi:MAG: hypothetical protein ACKO2C_05850 [Actinomycetes bacterium]